MTWVRLTTELEAIVKVDLPLGGSTLDELREAALQVLDESGGAEWDAVGGEVVATAERPLPHNERLDAEHQARIDRHRVQLDFLTRRP